MVTEAFLLTGASLLTGLDASAHVQAMLDWYYGGSNFLVGLMSQASRARVMFTQGFLG